MFFVYSHSMVTVQPSRHSSCTQFSMPSQAECRRVTPRRVFVGLGDKDWDNSKNSFQTRGFEFSFLPQRARRAAFRGSMAPKTPVLKLNRSLARSRQPQS